MFDANQFMSAVYTEVNDTKVALCPAGEYQAMIDKIEPRSGTISKGERTGEPWASLNVTWTVTDQAVLALLGRDKVNVFQSVMLDLTPTGGLDMGSGKNVNLGRLREAVNLNQPGQPFSPTMLQGRLAKIMVRHVPSFKDPSVFVAEVSGVVKG
jgi:hypothetical protein